MWNDPSKSFFISASAGSGKTTILVERIISLILNGESPSQILCITYTNAGAGEMRERISKKITTLTNFYGEQFAAEINKINKIFLQNFNEQTLKQRLQNAVLNEQIEISTFHAFCLKILTSFSIESQLEDGFKILETDTILQQTLQNNIKTQLLTNPQFANIINQFAYFYTNEGLVEKISNLINNISVFEQVNQDKTSIFLQKISPNFEAISLEKCTEHFANLFFERVDVEIALKAASEGASDRHFLAAVEAYSDATKQTSSKTLLYEQALSLFLNQGRDSIRKKISNKNSVISPILLDIYAQTALKAYDCFIAKEAFLYAKKVSLSLEAFNVVKMLYTQQKQQFNTIDFYTIITKTKQLLLDSKNADWINYKLGRKIKHILIDEAQDTNQNQWDIILKGIFQDLSFGESGGEERTIFIVGDEKQMIFSFQGSQFMMLDAIYKQIKNIFDITKIDRGVNFRSSPAILRFADEVFAQDEIIQQYQGLAVKHSSHFNFSGLVKVFDPACASIVKDKTEKENAILNPLIEKQENKVLAQQVCGHIKHLVESEGIAPSDIMLLAKSRDGELFAEIFASLAQVQIKIEDISHKTIEDLTNVVNLMHLASLCFSPQNNYALVYVLTSKMFGFEWQNVANICLQYNANKQNNQTFVEYITLNKANDLTTFIETYNQIKQTALQMPVENFLTTLIAKFINLYNFYEQGEFDYLWQIFQNYKSRCAFDQYQLSLLGFCEYFFSNLGAEIKNTNTSKGGESIRLSTIHSSKGMESKVVIMLDASKEKAKNTKTFFINEGVLILDPTKNEKQIAPSLTDYASFYKLQQSCEDLNLLYVALTRAKQYLYVFSKNDKGWCKYLQNAISNIGVGGGLQHKGEDPTPHQQTAPLFSDGQMLVYGQNQPQLVAAKSYSQLKQMQNNGIQNTEETQQGWLKKGGVEYGVAMHKMLELANCINTKQQAQLLLNAINYTGGESGTDKIIANFFAIKAQFSDLFLHPSACFEVEISNGQHFGRLDLLIKDGENITIIDFKTDSNPPQSPQLISDEYKQQLAFYKNIMLSLQPSASITCQILWTSTLTLTNIL